MRRDQGGPGRVETNMAMADFGIQDDAVESCRESSWRINILGLWTRTASLR